MPNFKLELTPLQIEVMRHILKTWLDGEGGGVSITVAKKILAKLPAATF